MILGEAALDAFIDANILLVVAYALWGAARLILRQAGLKHAYSTELKLLNGVFLAIVFSPFLVLGYTALQNTGMAADLNLSL